LLSPDAFGAENPPWLDSARLNAGTGGDTAFTVSSEQYPKRRPRAGGGQIRAVWSFDAPGLNFFDINEKTKTKWTQTGSAWDFLTYLTAFRSDFASNYTVLDAVGWILTFQGKRAPKGDLWEDNGSSVKLTFPFLAAQFPMPGKFVRMQVWQPTSQDL